MRKEYLPMPNEWLSAMWQEGRDYHPHPVRLPPIIEVPVIIAVPKPVVSIHMLRTALRILVGAGVLVWLWVELVQ